MWTRKWEGFLLAYSDCPVSLGGMSKGTQEGNICLLTTCSLWLQAAISHSLFWKLISFYLGSISVFCPCCCWCGKLLKSLSPLLTRNTPISRMSVTHDFFIVICSPANIVLHWNSSYPSLVFISGCINRLQSYPLSAFNHILSQHSFCRTNQARFSQFLHKKCTDPLFSRPSHGCSLVLFISLHMHDNTYMWHPRTELVVPSAECACFCLC